MKERLDYIDGIKAITCIMIVISHFYATFGYIFWGLDFFNEKMDLVFSGPWAVRFFFLLSAFLVSNSLYKNISLEKIKITVVKRYLRLALPLIPICFIIWSLQKLGFFHNGEVALIVQNEEIATYFSQNLGFSQIFEAAIYKIILLGDISFNSNFWMIQPLFIGNMLSIILCILTYEKKKPKTIFIFTMLISLAINDNYFPFIVGTTLSYWWMNYHNKETVTNTKKDILLWTIVFAGGFVIGEFKGYILQLIDQLRIQDYSYLQFLTNSNFYNTISIIVMLLAIIQLSYMKKILSNKILVGLGKISYYVFLLHWPIVCTFSSVVFIWLESSMSIAKAARITFIPTILLVIMIAFVFNKYVEKWCCNITNRIIRKI